MVNPIDFGGHNSKVKVKMVIIDKCGVRGDATLCVVIFKVIPKLSITSNSSILYFLYGARSYAEEFDHLKLQLCKTENSQFY